MLVEICLEGIESVAAAAEGGADRIELCENLAVGGVTPSSGMIEEALRIFPGPVHVLIRPRGGEYTATEREFAVMRADVARAKELGASGVVMGLLALDRTVDAVRMAELIALARPMSVTFHRAFDAMPDPLRALEELRELGVDRVLTSGGASKLSEGVENLKAWRERIVGGPLLLAGGGGRIEDLGRLAKAGVEEVHFATAAQRDGVTDARRIRELVSAAREAARR